MDGNQIDHQADLLLALGAIRVDGRRMGPQQILRNGSRFGPIAPPRRMTARRRSRCRIVTHGSLSVAHIRHAVVRACGTSIARIRRTNSVDIGVRPSRRDLPAPPANPNGRASRSARCRVPAACRPAAYRNRAPRDSVGPCPSGNTRDQADAEAIRTECPARASAARRRQSGDSGRRPRRRASSPAILPGVWAKRCQMLAPGSVGQRRAFDLIAPTSPRPTQNQLEMSSRRQAMPSRPMPDATDERQRDALCRHASSGIRAMPSSTCDSLAVERRRRHARSLPAGFSIVIS